MSLTNFKLMSYVEGKIIMIFNVIFVRDGHCDYSPQAHWSL